MFVEMIAFWFSCASITLAIENTKRPLLFIPQQKDHEEQDVQELEVFITGSERKKLNGSKRKYDWIPIYCPPLLDFVFFFEIGNIAFM